VVIEAGANLLETSEVRKSTYRTQKNVPYLPESPFSGSIRILSSSPCSK
jgi:hypothetical protein